MADKMQEYCARCDGCGWYEGGVSVQTKCEKCNGTGLVERPERGAASLGNDSLAERRKTGTPLLDIASTPLPVEDDEAAFQEFCETDPGSIGQPFADAHSAYLAACRRLRPEVKRLKDTIEGLKAMDLVYMKMAHDKSDEAERLRGEVDRLLKACKSARATLRILSEPRPYLIAELDEAIQSVDALRKEEPPR